jgi:hypothetical protein
VVTAAVPVAASHGANGNSKIDGDHCFIPDAVRTDAVDDDRKSILLVLDNAFKLTWASRKEINDGGTFCYRQRWTLLGREPLFSF